MINKIKTKAPPMSNLNLIFTMLFLLFSMQLLAHETYQVNVKITEQYIIVDSELTELSRGQSKCIIYDTNCVHIVKVKQTITTTKSFSEMADSEFEANRAAINNCKVEFKQLEKVMDAPNNHYMLRRFMVLSTE